MSHFDNFEWVDFVRGLGGDRCIELIQKHLGDGCPVCVKDLEVWRELPSFASREADYTPPASIVRIAKAAVFLRSGRSVLPAAQSVAKLVFDSFRQPQPNGVRSVGPAARHLLYKCGSLVIDLSLQSGASAEHHVLIGQVKDCLSGSVRDVQISLASDGQKLGETRANGFGEFFFEFKNNQGIWISLVIQDKREILIPLYQTLATTA